MTKKNHEGIAFNNTIYLSEDYYRRFPIYMRLLQALIIFVGSYCFMTIFIKCFDLKIINNYLITAIFLSGVVFYIFMIYPKHNIIKLLLVLATYAGIVYYRFEMLKNGFYVLENAIIDKASIYYGFSKFRFVANVSTADRDITILLIMIIIPGIGILSLALLRGRLKLLCYVIMLIPIVVSFAMGITPPEAELVTFILVLIFLSVSNGFSYDKSSLLNTFGNIQKSMVYRISIRTASILCLLVFLLFLTVKQFVPVKKYEDYNTIQDAKIKVQSFMKDFSINDIPDKLKDIKWSLRPNRLEGSGGLSLGQLGRVDQISYDETEHLIITAPLQSVVEGIYLKGYIGSEYTGDSWETHSRPTRKSYENMMAKISQDEFEPAIGSSILLSQYPYQQFVKHGIIDIEYIEANKNYVYAPYFTIFKEKDGVSFEYDLGTVSKKDMKVGTYGYSYNLSNILDQINNDFTIQSEQNDIEDFAILLKNDENELLYRKFVYETYTKLPEEGLDRLKHDFSKEEVGAASENVLDAIDYVKDYLNQNTRYTLSPGRLPKKKDFVEYFLYDNKIGYCAHFASAGALMLRAMGYPARYVEGYAVSRMDLMNPLAISYIGGENNTAEISVKDYNAHAWVEVYCDGFGWIPVEFTIDSGMEDMAAIINDIKETEQNATEEHIEPTEVPPSPTVKPDVEEIPSPPVSEQDEDINGSSIIKEDEDKPLTGYIWCLVVILILFAGIIIYKIVRSQSIKDITEECYSKKALRLYRKIEKLFILNHELPKKMKSLEEGEDYAKKHLTLTSVKDFERCMDTIRKARFGKDSISPMEYMIVEHYHNTLLERIYEGLPRIRKVFFKLYYSKKITI